MTRDLPKLMEVLISKILHDLISPISAVNNGAELVGELGVENATDAFDLIAQSARAASVKLQVFRMTYGAGGAEWHVTLDDVEKCFADMTRGEGRVKLNWGVIRTALPQPLPRGMPKLAMMGLLWANEFLPKGGTIDISATRVSDDHVTLTIAATGENAGVKPDAMDAFAGHTPADMLTPKTVHAAAMGLFATAYDVDVKVDGATIAITNR